MSDKAVNYIQGYDDGYEDAVRKFAPKDATREIVLNKYRFKDEPDMLSRCSNCGATFDIFEASDFNINYCPNCGSAFVDWVLV